MLPKAESTSAGFSQSVALPMRTLAAKAAYIHVAGGETTKRNRRHEARITTAPPQHVRPTRGAHTCRLVRQGARAPARATAHGETGVRRDRTEPAAILQVSPTRHRRVALPTPAPTRHSLS